MDSTVWDIARLGNTAGIEITATFHPDRITIRMRNTIKRMVMDGTLKGGWRSQAKRLTRALCDKFGIPMHNNNSYAVAVPSLTPEPLRAKLLELLKADEAAVRLEIRQDLAPYLREQYRVGTAALSREQPRTIHVRFCDPAIRTAAMDLMAEYVRNFAVEDRQRLCALLDSNEAVQVRFSASY